MIISFHCYIHSLSVQLSLFYPSLSPCISQHRSSASVQSTDLRPQTAVAPAIDYSRLQYLKRNSHCPSQFLQSTTHLPRRSSTHIRDLLTSIRNSTMNRESGVCSLEASSLALCNPSCPSSSLTIALIRPFTYQLFYVRIPDTHVSPPLASPITSLTGNNRILLSGWFSTRVMYILHGRPSSFSKQRNLLNLFSKCIVLHVIFMHFRM